MGKLPDREWLRLAEIDEFWFSLCDSKIASEWASRDPKALFTDVPESGAREEPTGRLDEVTIAYHPKVSTLTLVFEQKLSDAAFAGQVQFKGKRDSNDKSEHELIPSDYFSSHRGFFSETGAIEPAPSWVADDAALFHEVMSDKTTVWHDVLVHRDSFIKFVKDDFPKLNETSQTTRIPSKVNDKAGVERCDARITEQSAKTENTKRQAVREVVNELWPDGSIPAGLNAKDRNERINKLLVEKGLRPASPRTINRALAER